MPIQTLGPWPLGADNVRVETNAVFNRGRGEARLTVAQNVDIDDEGWLELRDGTTEQATGTAILNGGSYAGMLLIQDGGSIIKVTEGTPFTKDTLVSGLNASAKIHFHEFGGDVYYTNGLVVGKITGAGTATHWGLTVPDSPTLGQTAGDLPAGRYRVTITLVDADGAESGAPKATAITVDGTKDITATVSSPDANATHANIYVSTLDGEDVLWNQKVAVGALPATITDVEVSERHLRTFNMRAPIPGDGLSSHWGYMFTWVDGVLFRSRGQTPNLFHPMTEFFSFEDNVMSVMSLMNGFYVATLGGLYWISGNSPEEWKRTKVDSHTYAAGGLHISGSHIQALETVSEVALMASNHGLVVGLPDGQTRHLTDDRLNLGSTATVANFIYRESNDLRQVLMFLS